MNKKEVIVNEVKDGNKIEITKTKEGAYEIIVSHAFKTTTEITERTVKISDIFGLCIDSELRFPIYEDFRIELEFPTVVYLTGDSGSGKSWLLNNVFSRLDNSISLNDIKIDPNEIVIEGVGKNLDDALKKLSIAGLGDAFIYGRRFCELSDGQKFRYRICKLIDSDKDIWLIDEFASTLDRVTAKVVAFGLQKLARRLKKILIVATAHKDLRLELQADWFLDKGYGSDVYDECAMGFNEEYADQEKSEIFKHIEIGHGTMDDYKKLSQFHYRQKSLPAVKEIWKLTYYDDIEKETHLAGVMVISYPPLALKGRNIATNNEYAKMSKETCDRLNKDVATIARVIIHPRYRGVGLASFFVRVYLNRFATTRYVETIAVMARYVFFFQAAGMEEIPTPEDSKRNAMVAQLENYGFRTDLLSSSRYCKDAFEKLSQDDQIKVKEIVKTILLKYKGAIRKLNGKSIDEVVEKDLFNIFKELKRANTVYLIKEIEKLIHGK